MADVQRAADRRRRRVDRIDLARATWCGRIDRCRHAPSAPRRGLRDPRGRASPVQAYLSIIRTYARLLRLDAIDLFARPGAPRFRTRRRARSRASTRSIASRHGAPTVSRTSAPTCRVSTVRSARGSIAIGARSCADDRVASQSLRRLRRSRPASSSRIAAVRRFPRRLRGDGIAHRRSMLRRRRVTRREPRARRLQSRCATCRASPSVICGRDLDRCAIALSVGDCTGSESRAVCSSVASATLRRCRIARRAPTFRTRCVTLPRALRSRRSGSIA